MARPIIKAELVFAPDATTSGSVAYFPGNAQVFDPTVQSLVEQVDEWLWVVEFPSGANAGKIQFEAATGAAYSGTWSAVGSTVDLATGASQKYVQNTGLFSALRAKIDTSMSTGSVRVYVIGQGSPNP